MTTANANRALATSIQALLKQASDRRGTAKRANTEAGGYDGETSHPVKDVDDGTRDAQEGFRSAENTADVKADVPDNVDAASENHDEQENSQLDIGLENTGTGKTPEIETSGAEAGKEDGGTMDGASSHPARTDNDDLDGHKYSSTIKAIRQHTKLAESLGNDCLAMMAVEGTPPVTAKVAEIQAKNNGTKAAGADPNANGKPADPTAEAKAAEAGRQAAEETLTDDEWENIKRAAVRDVAHTLWDAYTAADRVAACVKAAKPKSKPGAKQSMDEEGNEEDADDDGGESEGGGEGGGGPPAESSPEEGGGAPEEEQILDALGGGGGPPAPGGEMGGPPAPGGDPLAAMGGGAPPPGGPGGGEMGGISPELIMMLLAALQQQQSSPEALAPKAANSKVAQALPRLIREGKIPRTTSWRPKTAAEQLRFDQVMEYLHDVLAK